MPCEQQDEWSRRPRSSPAGQRCTKAGPSIVIGQVGGFTGIVSNVLLPSRIGTQVWVQDIKARGGINCHPVKLFQVDDGLRLVPFRGGGA